MDRRSHRLGRAALGPAAALATAVIALPGPATATEPTLGRRNGRC